MKVLDREQEVARRLNNGQCYKEIANQCFISLSTVTNHVNSIFQKLQISRSTQLSKFIGFTNGQMCALFFSTKCGQAWCVESFLCCLHSPNQGRTTNHKKAGVDTAIAIRISHSRPLEGAFIIGTPASKQKQKHKTKQRYLAPYRQNQGSPYQPRQKQQVKTFARVVKIFGYRFSLVFVHMF